MNRTIILTLTVFLQCACVQRPGSKTGNQTTLQSDASSFYSSVIISYKFLNKGHQRLTDLIAEASIQLSADENAVVNTEAMRQALDSAREIHNTRIAILKKAEEMDSSIGSKAKVMRYLTQLDSAYNNEFVKYISCLATKEKDREFRASQILLPRMIAIKFAQEECDVATKAMEEKYYIKVSDGPENSLN